MGKRKRELEEKYEELRNKNDCKIGYVINPDADMDSLSDDAMVGIPQGNTWWGYPKSMLISTATPSGAYDTTISTSSSLPSTKSSINNTNPFAISAIIHVHHHRHRIATIYHPYHLTSLPSNNPTATTVLLSMFSCTSPPPPIHPPCMSRSGHTPFSPNSSVKTRDM